MSDKLTDNLEKDLNNTVEQVVINTVEITTPKIELYKAIANFNRLYIERNIRIEKTSKNPFLGNKYADLNSINNAILGILTEANLVFIVDIDEDEMKGSLVEITSGQFVSSKRSLSSFYMNRKGDPQNTLPLSVQEFGSMITYLTRYFLKSILNLSTDEEDDGNAASNTKPKLSPTEKTLYKGKLSKKEITIEELKEKYNISKDEERMLLN